MEEVEGWYPTPYSWKLVARDKKGKVIKGYELDRKEAEQAVMNALATLNPTTAKKPSPVPKPDPEHPAADDKNPVTLLVHTTTQRAREISDMPDTDARSGEWSKQSQFVSYSEGSDILVTIGCMLEAQPPDWAELTPQVQKALVVAAASSATWHTHNDLSPKLVDDLFEQFPQLRAMFILSP